MTSPPSGKARSPPTSSALSRTASPPAGPSSPPGKKQFTSSRSPPRLLLFGNATVPDPPAPALLDEADWPEPQAAVDPEGLTEDDEFNTEEPPELEPSLPEELIATRDSNPKALALAEALQEAAADGSVPPGIIALRRPLPRQSNGVTAANGSSPNEPSIEGQPPDSITLGQLRGMVNQFPKPKVS